MVFAQTNIKATVGITSESALHCFISCHFYNNSFYCPCNGARLLPICIVPFVIFDTLEYSQVKTNN